MNLIYVLTILIILILHILIYKKEEKQNLLKWIGISITILLCYNVFICLIMSFINIRSTLINLSIINVIIIFLLGVKIYKDKKIQKYEIKKMDILTCVLMLIITVIMVINQYGIPINVKNGITDATVHYFVADEFYNNSILLYHGNNDVFNLWKVDFFMPGAYINTGILFKIFSGIISETYFCQLFFIFDISMWYLSGILMYILLSKNKNQENKKILPLIFSVIYMLGYPLNSLLSGFSYLSVALNIIIVILIIMREKINKYYKWLLMFLLDFGIFFSYYFFAPVVYFSIFLQIVVETKENNKKFFTKESITNILYTLVLPGILGVLFFGVFQFIKFGTNPVTNSADIISIPGEIYSNIVTNVIVFLVLSINFIIYCIKNRKNDISNKMLVTAIIFMFLLFVGTRIKVVSEYYYFKSYYLLWIPLIGVAFNGIEKLVEKSKKIEIVTYSIIIIYYIGIILAFTFDKNLFIFDIYRENSSLIKSELKVVSAEELDILEYYNKNINTSSDKLDDKTYMCIPKIERGREIWIYAITRNPYNYIDLSFGELTTDLQQFIDSEKQYCVLFKEDYYGDYSQINEKIKQNNLKVLFRNDVGIILEKN